MGTQATVITDLSHLEMKGNAKVNQRQVRLQRSLRSSWLRVDMFCLCATMLAIVFTPSIDTHQSTLANVLALRVSLINVLLTVLCVVLWRLCLYATTLQAGSSPVSVFLLTFQILLRVTGCTGVAGLVLWLRHPGRLAVTSIAAFWSISMLLFIVGRMITVALAIYVAPLLRRDRRIIVVGSGWRAKRVIEQIGCHPKWRYQVLGFVDSEPQFDGKGILGSTADLETILMQQIVDEVIIALPMKSKYDEIQKAIAACERMGVQSGYSMDLFLTEITKRRSVEKHDSSSVVLHMIHNDDRRHLKRALDVAGAMIGLTVLSPLLIVVAVAIKLTSRGPVIFRQQRFGLNKRIFHMYKFRSMVLNAESQQKQIEHLNEAAGPVFKIRNDPRITSLGRVIRKTSIDELPQLINVLRGEMSLVGPRPLPMRDVSRFSEAWLMRRFSVRPGLTGLWQVSGRSDTAFASWVELDLRYIDTWTLLLDVRILAKTFPAVLRGRGAV